MHFSSQHGNNERSNIPDVLSCIMGTFRVVTEIQWCYWKPAINIHKHPPKPSDRDNTLKGKTGKLMNTDSTPQAVCIPVKMLSSK